MPRVSMRMPPVRLRQPRPEFLGPQVAMVGCIPPPRNPSTRKLLLSVMMTECSVRPVVVAAVACVPGGPGLYERQPFALQAPPDTGNCGSLSVLAAIITLLPAMMPRMSRSPRQSGLAGAMA